MPPTFQIRVLLAGILFVPWDVRAFPISAVNPQYISSSCNDLHHCRAIWNIIWNSLATIFACTWVAVHPNIPDPDPKRAKAKFWQHRLMIMVITLIVPELVITWAMRQWLFVFRKATKGAFCFYDAKSAVEVFRSSGFESYNIFCPYGRFYG